MVSQQALEIIKISIPMRGLPLLIAFTLSCCSQQDNEFPNFDKNGSINDIDRYVKDIVLEKDFSVVFCSRAEASYGWYKIFSKQGENWEKIEIRQWIFNEKQLRSDPEYYIARDITTRKLCKPEEAKSFLTKLISYRLFELPEEDELFEDCKNTGIADLGSTYIQIVAGEKVRNLKYSGMYKCEGNERESIRKH
ncbi:hypothetical protein [Ohtaekwangia koreensis]|uniref:Uncharacterized protein n=1 Tax=Ohtaekwangia koreensis TaxID=688867 RepID=A0A1T5LT35_9BACT|nr:hypothetical protein [Ohtaekwangia koreensis]SKC78985.1 hypothetical protein SAMN05660236_3851 [Ohtaekwangia koreensis]